MRKIHFLLSVPNSNHKTSSSVVKIMSKFKLNFEFTFYINYIFISYSNIYIIYIKS